MIQSPRIRWQQAVLQVVESAIIGADSPEVRLGYAEALKSLGRTKEADEQMAAYRKLSGRS